MLYIAGRQAEKHFLLDQKMYLQTIHLPPAVYSRQPLLSARWKIPLLNSLRKPHLRSPRTQSLHCLSSCWTRAAGGRWSPQFSQEKGTSKSGAFSICDRRELSLFTASAAAGPEPRGADDHPNSLKKRDEQERSFSQRKGSQWTHSIPSRTERACSPPNA